ncbi:MAG: primosomal protein N' [Peptococcaceae bacterium]|nr:primosomal protein N' [Peptococcaceae bacterium]
MFALVLIVNTNGAKDLILSYAVPEGQTCLPGMLFSVGLRGRQAQGLVLRLTKNRPQGFQVQPLGEALQPQQVVTRRNLALMRWLARYYVCPLNRAAALFLPPPVRLRQEERYFVPAREGGAKEAGLPGKKGRQPKSREDTPPEGGSPEKGPARGAAGEPAEGPVTPAGEQMLFMDPVWQELWQALEKAGAKGMSRERLRSRFGREAAEQAERWWSQGLLRKEESYRQGRRIPRKDPLKDPLQGALSLELEPDQARALERIRTDVLNRRPGRHLLFGVTGSGKTEVYLQAAKAAAAAGRQTICLVPEISLVPQLTAKALQWFEGQVAVLHSNLTASQRYEEWRRIREGRVKMIIGPRSALFAPVSDLGLIIIDEEHENTYKQSEPDPRYDARKAAEILGRLWRAPLVRGSATPDLESYYRAQAGGLTLSRLEGRVQGRPLPRINWIDMNKEMREGHNQPVSRRLLAEIAAMKERGEQGVLLMNRRGFHTYVLCRDCGHTLECPHCSIALTCHRSGKGGQEREVVCHYCGYRRPLPPACPHCGSRALQYMGTGTQRVEDYLARTLPELRILRLDLDSTAKAGSHTEILKAFQSGAADLLLGTQMVSKGFDFPKVTLAAVLHIDGVLNLPDYQSGEKAFQLIVQTAGRAGRGQRPGQVYIQTFFPDNPLLMRAEHYDYEGFYRQEILIRQALGYPPFNKAARILVSSPDEAAAQARMEEILSYCRQRLDARELAAIHWLGPSKAPIERIKNRWRCHTILLAPRAEPLRRCLALARESYLAGGEEPRVILDMEPKSFL